MTFNPTKLFIVLAAIAVLYSCKKEDDDNSTSGDGSYKVEYKNQVLQGKIDGTDWIFAIGETHSTKGGFNSTHEHWFEMIDTAQIDSCYLTYKNRSKLSFFLGADNRLLPVGKYKLSFDNGGRSVTLYVPPTQNNIICTEGEYEILTVDTVTKVVTGRMDAYYDKQNYLNGNFTIKYCYW